MTLPAGWQSAPLSELVGPDGLIADGDWVETKDQDPDGEVRLTQLADVGDGFFRDRSSRFLTRKRAEELRCTLLTPGDVLIARMPDPLGRACIFPLLQRPCVSVVDVCIVRLGRNGVDPRWLMYAVNAPETRRTIAGQQQGTTRKRISKARLLELEFPVPPLPEQRRIVEALDTLFTRLDAAVATLERVRAKLKRYRAAVLRAAIERKLGGAADEREWESQRLGDLGECITGTTPPTANPENYGGDVPFFKPTDLDAGYHVVHARQTLSRRGVSAARPLQAGSVLVTCIGATIGKTGFARVDCATNQQINAFVPSSHAGDPRWYYWCLVSPLGQRQIRESASATTLPILNKSRFQEIVVPVPPVDEQRRVVDEVERLFSLIDAAEGFVETNEVRAARLRQSLLRVAFAGRLVPQHPSDEPAVVLLERIRAERASNVTAPKKKPARSRR